LKIVDAATASAAIKDGSVVVIGGTGAVLEPDAVLDALERRYLSERHPLGLTVITPMCPGERSGQGGLNCVAHDGMLDTIISASFVPARHPRLLEMIVQDRCRAYSASMGALVQLMTAVASDKPGVFTRAGLGSFLDPRHGGGRMNGASDEPLCRLMELDGREYIFYPARTVDVAIVRGSVADEDGYVSCEDESNVLAVGDLAAAAKASRGLVIVQVDHVVPRGSLDPQLIRIPAALVDHVVVAPREHAPQSQGLAPLRGREPYLSGRKRGLLRDAQPVTALTSQIILRRATLELRPGDTLNVGAGVPTHLPRVLFEDGLLDQVTVTNEHGIFGGLLGTAWGGTFVASVNPRAIMDSTFQFNFYDGGGLDAAFLGIGEVDREGNVNVSRFGRVINGSGGFTNITERTERIVFCGSLTAGGLEIQYHDGKIEICQEGAHRKFVDSVEEVTFNGPRALARRQRVVYVTERAVFELVDDGLRLIEVAPGIEIERDVLPQMAFAPIIDCEPAIMPARVFGHELIKSATFAQ
jgi:propionate CoA-transferase